MQELNSRFGSVCPLLKLAQHYGQDYTAVLQYADAYIHDRDPVGESLINRIGEHGDYNEITQEIRTIGSWMRKQHAYAESLEADGRLAFENGKWVELAA